MTDNLLQEVNEALRADKAQVLWQKYGKFLIGLVVALILAAAISSAWDYYRQQRGAAILAQLTENQALLEGGNAKQAAAGFAEIAAATRGDRRTLAQLWQGRALVADGQKDAAIPVLTTAAEGNSLWADIACLRLAGVHLQAAKCLASPQNSPLATTRHSWAAATSWATGDRTAALTSIEKLIADPQTSEEEKAQLTQWRAAMQSGKEAH